MKRRPKSHKSFKLWSMQPLLRVCVDVLIVVRRECGVVRGVRLRICDIECKVRWYIDINLGLAIFKKSDKSLNS